MKCSKHIKGAANVSSNFGLHLKRRHLDILDEYRTYVQGNKIARKSSASSKTTTKATCSFDQDRFNKNVVIFILDNMLPFRIVESSSFRLIYADLNIKKGEEMMLRDLSREKVKKIANDLMEIQKNEIKDILKSVDHVCSTADVWSAPNRSFMGVTAHWMDKISLHRKSAVLACRRFKGSHTHEKITELLFDINNSFNLTSEKIIGTVTDNGSNFIKAFALSGTRRDVTDSDNERVTDGSDSEGDNDEDLMDVEDEPTNDDDSDCSDTELVDLETYTIPEECVTLSQHFRCASHILNLIATTDAMKLINSSSKLKTIHSSAISNCEALWKSLKSVQKREKLNEFFGECLQKPNVTRWNSMYKCLKQIYKLKKKIIEPEISQILKKKIGFEESDFVHINHYLAIMEHLASAINLLQGDENCYYGQLIPTLITIEQRWLEKSQSMNSKSLLMYKDLVQGMAGSLKKRFCDMFNIVGVGEFAAVATLTHPTFKKSWVKCLSSEAQANVERLIQSKQQSSSIEALPKPIANNFFYFGKSTESTNLDKIVSLKTRSSELLRFLAEPPSESLLELNRFPKIKKLFLKYNTILPSSAPVERLFSYATMLNIPKYNKLSDSQFEKRLVYKANLNKMYK
ncbi:hypothetical protein TKK_0004148 [Trichogramma kaykai]